MRASSLLNAASHSFLSGPLARGGERRGQLVDAGTESVALFAVQCRAYAHHVRGERRLRALHDLESAVHRFAHPFECRRRTPATSAVSDVCLTSIAARRADTSATSEPYWLAAPAASALAAASASRSACMASVTRATSPATAYCAPSGPCRAFRNARISFAFPLELGSDARDLRSDVRMPALGPVEARRHLGEQRAWRSAASALSAPAADEPVADLGDGSASASSRASTAGSMVPRQEAPRARRGAPRRGRRAVRLPRQRVG